MTFSSRVQGHRRISAYQPTSNDPLVLAVKDQLLVCRSGSSAVHEALRQLEIESTPITTMMTGITPVNHSSDDVEILRVDLPPRGRTIFDVTADVRSYLSAQHPQDDLAKKVSPNHVLIPANESHSCPYGPPAPTTTRGFPVPKGNPPKPIAITIIDSGYQWNTGGAEWGANPLAPFVTASERAEWIDPQSGLWVPGKPEQLDADDDGKLDALAGHANFIAGVIAQQCDEHVQITIRNHNGGFAAHSDDYPTEAAVARSLCVSAGADVINLGFAFPAFQDIVSCAWPVAFEQIGKSTVVVSPAGNQESPTARYPAALNTQFRDRYPNMIGVGSTDRPGAGAVRRRRVWRPMSYAVPNSGLFSNYGMWVTCSANGNDVPSTFLKVKMPVEDPPLSAVLFSLINKSRNFLNGWATWSGTSFAAPKVVAEIANRIPTAGSPMNAWLALRAEGVQDVRHRLGVMFNF
jgi:thermitase